MNDIRTIVLEQPKNGNRLPVQHKIPRFNDNVSGMDLLIQLVVNNILTTAGADYLNPGRGGSLFSNFRKRFERDEIVTQMVHAINKVESDMIAEQGLVDFPADERLASLQITSLEYRPEKGALDIVLLITNELQETEDVLL